MTPLAALQQALARLYTDGELRARSRRDPGGVARELGIAPETLAELTAAPEPPPAQAGSSSSPATTPGVSAGTLNPATAGRENANRAGRPDPLEAFARSLIGKRRGEVEKLLPRTVQRLGDRFRPLFGWDARDRPIPDEPRHQQDAEAFARFLMARARAPARNRTPPDSGDPPDQPPVDPREASDVPVPLAVAELATFEADLAMMHARPIRFRARWFHHDPLELRSESDPRGRLTLVLFVRPIPAWTLQVWRLRPGWG